MTPSLELLVVRSLAHCSRAPVWFMRSYRLLQHAYSHDASLPLPLVYTSMRRLTFFFLDSVTVHLGVEDPT